MRRARRPPRATALLDRATLRRLAGERAFERGESYHAGRRVRELAEDRGMIAATVRGTREYRVKLRAEKGVLVGYACTCPVGAGGAFCKHCVAVGLAWIEGADQGRTVAGKAARPGVTMDDVRAHLAAADKDVLVGMLMDQAKGDDRLRRNLLLRAGKGRAQGLDPATYRQAIDEAVDTGGFVAYEETYDYARGIDEAVDSIEELLKAGHAAEVVELAEHALAAVEAALHEVDDSSGSVGGILERLQEIHLKACRKAKPDPEGLARRLFEWELATDWDTFHDAAERYARVLGMKGMAAYRALAQAEWDRLPSRAAGGREGADHDHRRWRITQIMEALARRTGRVEDLVEVKKRDLSSAWAYLQIAEEYKKARQHDRALEWAEKGVAAFAERTDPRLREFLAGEYHRRRRHGDAMALVWANFADRSSLEEYQSLKRHAERAEQWPTWRDKALALLRQQVAQGRRGARSSSWAWTARADHSLLVSVFLWENDAAAALREAKAGGCSDALWVELASRLEKERPEEALPIYQAQIEPALAPKHEQAYRQAVELLRRVSGLMARLGRNREFAPYLAKVRAAHGRKRNFVKLLDRARWSA